MVSYGRKFINQIFSPNRFNNRLKYILFLRPDTFIYTTADKDGFLVSQPGMNFLVSYDGEIFWPSPQTRLRVRCSMGILWV